MSPTVTGPNTFLGAGSSWQAVSLSGKADLHALGVSGTSVYGLDATTGGPLVSVDADRSWEARGSIAARDLTVGPSRPDVLLATTQQGLVRSTDGGRPWQPVTGSPLLAVLAGRGGGSRFGTSPDGTVYRSDDRGLAWRRVGAVDGGPVAMAADGTGAVVVASRDAGTTFSGCGA